MGDGTRHLGTPRLEAAEGSLIVKDMPRPH
jgi:hypothetical protein